MGIILMQSIEVVIDHPAEYLNEVEILKRNIFFVRELKDLRGILCSPEYLGIIRN